MKSESNKAHANNHFRVPCLVFRPLNKSEARLDFVMIQSSLLLKFKVLCCHDNWCLLSIL